MPSLDRPQRIEDTEEEREACFERRKAISGARGWTVDIYQNERELLMPDFYRIDLYDERRHYLCYGEGYSLKEAMRAALDKAAEKGLLE
jgi:hypothetical protein